MTPEQATVLHQLKPTFIHHPECKKPLPGIMSERGVALGTLSFDERRLRSAGHHISLLSASPLGRVNTIQ